MMTVIVKTGRSGSSRKTKGWHEADESSDVDVRQRGRDELQVGVDSEKVMHKFASSR